MKHLYLKARLPIAWLGFFTLVTASAATLNVNPGDSIQEAVNAAVSGDTIQIAAGTYQQQILISNKDLNLVGEAGALLTAPPGMTRSLAPFTTRRAVLGILLSQVNVSGLAFDGGQSGQTNARLTGVYYLASSGTVSDCSFEGFRAVPRNSLTEVAYIAANITAAGADTTYVEVLDSTFSGNEANIVIVGDDANPAVASGLRQTFLVQGNSVTGSGADASVFEAGIRVTVGASGVVHKNTVKDFLSVTQNPVLGPVGSVGILVFDTSGVGNPPNRPNGPIAAQPVLVEGNRLANNAVGLSLFVADGSLAVNNQIEAGPSATDLVNAGGINLSGIGVSAVNNSVSESFIGINLLAHPVLGTASNAKVIANTILDSTTPINQQTGVTGTTQRANKISP